MKSFAIASILLGCFLLFANADDDYQMDNDYFVNKGQECTDLYCFLDLRNGLRHGYFNETRLIYNTLYNLNTKVLYSQIPTNFLVHIKKASGSIQICYFSGAYRSNICELINSVDDQIFTFSGTQKVELYATVGAQLHVQYYAGCDILDGKDLALARKTVDFSGTPGFCWIMIPRLFDGSNNQYTALSNVFFYNTSIPQGVEVGLYNLLSGEYLLNLENSEVDLATVEASKNATIYQKTKRLSTVLLLNIESCLGGKCTQLELDIEIQTLGKKDLDCFRKKQDCNFPFPGTECTQQDKEEKCEAFTTWARMLDVPTANQNKLEQQGRWFGKKRSKQCSWNFRGRAKKVLCAKKRNGEYANSCEKLKPCHLWCFEQRFAKRLCKKSLRIYQ